MEKRLRLAHVLVQPVLVWDDGDEMVPGPQLNTHQLRASELAEFAANLPGEVEKLAAQLHDQAAETDS